MKRTLSIAALLLLASGGAAYAAAPGAVNQALASCWACVTGCLG